MNWSSLHNIPVAFITGTNGKTTTTRLLEAIARASGKVAGLTSTEFVRVGNDILDRGDYSGPGGGRMLLRDKRLEIACLEVARGGILRRGLPTRAATAAAVTNVANDHLGQYGVNTVPELAQAKFAVHRTLAKGGVLVLNADDAYVRAEAANTPAEIWWFSLDAQNDLIRQARDAGKCCAYVQNNNIVFFNGSAEQVVIAVSDVPLTMSSIALLYQDDGFGRVGLNGVNAALEKRGMSLAAEGTYTRNTTAVKKALLAIRKSNPDAVVMVGAYKPVAEFIKLARKMKMTSTFVNISFVGSDALSTELGDAGEGVIISQVVPFPCFR